ncbi:MAG: hypothetical protein IJ188_06805 [Clostridia bacterium]|nr:hypothetical protein [Clostridia bacterium]
MNQKEREFQGKWRKTKAKGWGKSTLLAALAWLGLSLTLPDPGKSQILLNLIASFRDFDLLWLLVLPGLYFLFQKADRVAHPDRRWTHLIPACFFGANMVLGFAFRAENRWDMLWSLHNGQLLKTLILWAAWSLVLDRALVLFFALLNRAGSSIAEHTNGRPARKGLRPLRWYVQAWQAHPFATPFLTMLICFLPHFLMAYPAMFMGDTWSIVVQGYPELGLTGVDYLAPEKVLQPGVMINQHHSPVYTLMLHAFLQLGTGLFHSLNTGIFLYVLLQAIAMIAAMAYVLSTLSHRRIAMAEGITLMVYFLLHPQIRNFLLMVTKDGLYAACFITAMTAGYRLWKKQAQRRDVAVILLAAAGSLLLRKEAQYVLLLSGILMALLNRQHRKAILGFTAGMMVFILGVTHGLYPRLGYTPGGKQEALSVPFQQTARYLRDHPDDVSAEERAAIDGVLEYDLLAGNYVPDGADPVKGLYRQEATGAELIAYFKAWGSMLLRHPDTYFQATYNNYYQYLYPGDTRINFDKFGWSAWMCEFTNNRIEPLGISFSLPGWNERGRLISDSLVDAGILDVPPFSWLMTPALYSWMLISLLFWAASRPKGSGRRHLVMLMIPELLTLLVAFAGPTNGFYSRYMLPLTAFLPALMLVMISETEEGAEREG